MTTPPNLPNASDPRLLVNLRTGRAPLPPTPHNPKLIQYSVGEGDFWPFPSITADDWSNLALGFLLGCTAWVVALPWLPH